MIKLEMQEFENKVRILGILESNCQKFIQQITDAADRGESNHLINQASLATGQKICLLRDEFPEIYELFPLCNYFRDLASDPVGMEKFANNAFPHIEKGDKRISSYKMKLPEIIFLNFPLEDDDGKGGK